MEKERSTPVQVERPVVIDGAVVRLMSDGITDWTEHWRAGAWHREGHGYSVREFMKAPVASRKTLAECGVPPD